jgi:hypothetical protein
MDPAEEARQAAARVGHLEARLTGSQALGYLASAGVVGAIAMIAALLFLFAGHSLALLLCGIVLAPFSLLLGLNTLYQYLSKRPTLVLDGEGIHHVLFGSVGWRDIVGFSLIAMRGRNESVPILAIGLAPGVRMRGAVPWSVARGPTLRISLLGLTEAPAPILAMAEVLRDRVSPPRLKNWFPGMSQASVAAQLESQRLMAGFGRLAATAGRHDASEESELRKMTEELDANVAEQRRVREGEAKRLRFRFQFIRAGLILLVLVGVWRLFALAAAR